jgi:glycosyltransferase involved in cell wall biosynthesis
VTNQQPSISAFFPAYNDAGTIASMVIGTARVLERLASEHEIIVVDDGSRDATSEILEELGSLYGARLRVVRHAVNRGYGGALRSGIGAARYDWIFYTDGDAQYDVRELALLATQIRADVDAINGYKIARSDPMYRKVIGCLYNHFVKRAFGLRIRDVDCDFRLVRRNLFQQLDLMSTSGTICVEMIKKLQDAGCRFAEVPVHHFHRAVGRSQFFRPRWLVKTFLDLLVLWRQLMLNQSPARARQKVKVASAAAGAECADKCSSVSP